MANRRMLSKDVVCSDKFLDMSFEARALYTQMNMNADDDGFIAAPKMEVRVCGCKDGALEELIGRGYILMFESGVCVLAHWKLCNYIQNDRYHETVYLEEKARLAVGENGVYYIAENSCIHSVSKMDTEVRLGEVRSGQDRSGKNKSGKNIGGAGTAALDSTPSSEHTFCSDCDCGFDFDEIERLSFQNAAKATKAVAT